MARQPNLAARAGRWSASHRKLAILGWLAFVLAAAVIGGIAGMNYQRDEDLGTGESGRADTSSSSAASARATIAA
jgi:uncharacterized membrane protein YdfJ with MMPL/SSD domain